MMIEQFQGQTCAICALILDIGALSKREKAFYQKHLQMDHHLQPYFIPR